MPTRDLHEGEQSVRAQQWMRLPPSRVTAVTATSGIGVDGTFVQTYSQSQGDV